MSRLALYRKWRPMTFRDVVEQRHVVETLRNALKSDAIGHAYLFCGTRGTGKTTMAKIFARAINCLAPLNGDPCNECSVCKGILDGSVLDVMEMDAASNNSVDNIRDIRDEVIYAPAIAKYKVYIIDEVHMLSQGAFNALLKTLEEPPDRVVFILATTEPQKLPATVLSRCQRFDFKRITEAGISERLGEIAADCGISVTPAALLLLARLAGGALRDAISLLDQLTTLGRDHIDLQDVNEMAGFASNAAIRQLAGALLAGDIAASWTALDTLMREGRDLSQLCVQLLGWFRNALLLQIGGESSPLLDLHPDDMEEARRVAGTLSGEELSSWLRELSEHELRLRRTDNPRIMMEVLLLRLCTRSTGSGARGSMMAGTPTSDSVPQTASAGAQRGRMDPQAGSHATPPGNAGMDERLIRMERKLAEISARMDATPVAAKPAGTGTAGAGSTTQGADMAGLPASGFPSSGAARKADDPDGASQPAHLPAGTVAPFKPWPRVIDEIRRLGPSRPGGMKLFAYLLDTECLQLADQQLRVVVPADDFLKRKVLQQSDSLEMVGDALRSVTGDTWQLRIVDTKEAASLGSPSVKTVAGDSQRAKAESLQRDETAISPGDGNSTPSMNGNFATGDAGGAGSTQARSEKALDSHSGTGASTEDMPDAQEVSTGDESLDLLLKFSRETGFPVEIQEDPES